MCKYLSDQKKNFKKKIIYDIVTGKYALILLVNLFSLFMLNKKFEEKKLVTL